MARAAAIAVRGHPLLSVDVSDLLRHPGKSETFAFRHAFTGLAVPLASVEEGSELDFDLRLDALVDGIEVTGRVSGTVTLECRRCLVRFGERFEVQLDELYLYPGRAGGAAYEIVDEHIDLEPVVRDEVVLALPLNPLCREDCRGLCPACGADRNEADCGHAVGRIDVRWGPLERLREQMEE